MIQLVKIYVILLSQKLYAGTQAHQLMESRLEVNTGLERQYHLIANLDTPSVDHQEEPVRAMVVGMEHNRSAKV